MHIRPLNDRVVIRRKEPLAKSAGGIIIPDNAKEKPVEGEVLAVGPGLVLADTGAYRPMEVKVGDVVLFGKYAGIEVTIEGESLTVMAEIEILAVVDRSSP
jgi:chaperonin GroES